MSTFRFHEISEFERVQFRQKLQEDLESLNEIQSLLESSLPPSNEASDFYKQRAKTLKLKEDLKTKLHQVDVEKHLKMLTINTKDMKKLQKNLKKRRIQKIGSKQAQEKLSFLENRLEEEILQEEYGLKAGFKSFPITSSEMDLLLSIKVV